MALRNHAILSIGGNLGDRVGYLSRAVRALRDQDVEAREGGGGRGRGMGGGSSP